MKYKFIFFAFILFFGKNQAQTKEFENVDYDWEANPTISVISEAEKKESALIIKDKRVKECVQYPNEETFLFETFHKIIRVNNDEGVESFNKIYISMGNVIDLLTIKVRVIKKDGSIINLDNKSIKDVENFQNAGPFKIIAVEGVESGSEIEYFYTQKKDLDYFGKEVFQLSSIVKNSSFELITPRHLIYDYKSFNGLPNAIHDTLKYKGKHSIAINVAKIDPLPEEEYSSHNANLQRFEYKFSYNLNKNTTRNFTWNDAANRVFSMIATGLDKEDKTALQEMFKAVKITKKMSDSEKILAIENFVKSTIAIENTSDSDLGKISAAFTKKYTNQQGLVRLFYYAFKEQGIDVTIGLTTNRSHTRFDPSFESWNYLENYLFYIPKLNTYFAPSELLYRLGMIPYDWTANYGLFIKTTEKDKIVSVVGETRFIESLKYTQNFDNINLDVKIEPKTNNLTIHMKRMFSGYNAMFIQPVYEMLQEDKKTTVLQEMLKQVAPDAVMITGKAINTSNKLSPIEFPFIIEGDLKTSSLVEKAGTKLLFKIGEIIGPQVEMYQNSVRKTEIENTYNRVYERNIVFEIPEGYTLTNIDDLKMDIYFEENNTRTMTFTSEYKLVNNKVEVHIMEYYKNILYPLAQIEPFRKVINAAADFNKITLIFQKSK